MNNTLDLKLIHGGLDGFVSIVCDHIKCINKSLIKEQILISNDIVIKGFDDFDVMYLADVIRGMAYGVLDINCVSNDYINNVMPGNIMLFGGGDSNFEKCQTFILDSQLEDYEKTEILDELKKSKLTFNLFYLFKDIFFEDYPDFYNIIPFVKDFSIEKEYRLTKLKNTLGELDKAINKNKELITLSTTPKHLQDCAKIANKCYEYFWNAINKDLHGYINSINLRNLEELGKSKQEIINKLIEKTKKEVFDKYENRLVSQSFLSSDRNNWLKKSADLVRFYNYCETKGIINRAYEKNRKGMKLIRELYNYKENESIDSSRGKRLKQTAADKFQFNFLDII